MSKGIKVFAPATLSNIVDGSNYINLALSGLGNEIIIKTSETPGLTITKITGGKGLSTEIEQNPAGLAAQRLLEHLEATDKGFEMEIHNRIPLDSGMGAYEANAVASVIAINEVLRRPLSKRELFPFAIQSQAVSPSTFDLNRVATCLLGGINFIKDAISLDIHRLPVPKGLFVSSVYPSLRPKEEENTTLSKGINTIQQIEKEGNVAGLSLGMYTANLELMRRSLKNIISSKEKEALVFGFEDMEKQIIEAGALGCNISNTGNSIFAISMNSLIAEEVEKIMAKTYESKKIRTKVYQSSIDQEGAILL